LASFLQPDQPMSAIGGWPVVIFAITRWEPPSVTGSVDGGVVVTAPKA
jgi:hypothetical protein